MIIYLYVKQQPVSGLKYFGRTIRKDPFKYKGSGTYWVNHYKKYMAKKKLKNSRVNYQSL
jgi:hypothetical protein